MEVDHVAHSWFYSQLLLIVDRDLRLPAALLTGMGQAGVGGLVHGILVMDLLILPQVLAIRVHLTRHATLGVDLF